MEHCDLGELMKYNSDFTGYEYNPKIIKFLFQNFLNEKNFEKEKNNKNFQEISKFLEENPFSNYNYLELTEGADKEEEYYLNLFKRNIKIKIFFTKIIFKKIFLGLKYLHSKNICNKDIKPENILFKSFINSTENTDENNESDDFVKISDFSISKIYEKKDVKILSFLGSDLFKSPEMISFEYFNPFKAEIYSLGATLFYFLFKKFYRSNKIKNMDGDSLQNALNSKYEYLENNNLKRDNSKLVMKRSRSILSRPRQSSIIFNNFENMKVKDFEDNLEDIKTLLVNCDNLDLYNLLSNMLDDDPENRKDIDEILQNSFLK